MSALTEFWFALSGRSRSSAQLLPEEHHLAPVIAVRMTARLLPQQAGLALCPAAA